MFHATVTDHRRIAVIDIGKSNAKLALVDRQTLTETAVVTRPNTVLPGPPYPHFDLDGHWRFILDGLAAFHRDHGVDGIAVTTHGASAVLLDAEGGLATPMLDYEHPGPDDLADSYDALRPDFAECGSPRLSAGLNVGAQLHWLLQTVPDLDAHTATILPYPQYWAFRLTGVAAGEASSWGAHTDLWNPTARRFSSLVDRLGLTDRMAPVRPATDILGPILPGIAAETGLPPDTPVVCGLHDSNASLYPHLLNREQPFSVVSTGTWVISMAVGGAAVMLDPQRDTLINVNAQDDPVPSARFMGGREYQMTMGDAATDPTPADISQVLEVGLMLLPSVDPANGPYQGRTATWRPEEPPRGSGLRAAAVSHYLAMMTAAGLNQIGHRGRIVVEGAFARNPAYLAMLAATADSPVTVSQTATGTSIGAALLFGPSADAAPAQADAAIAPLPGGAAYHRAWRAALGA